MLLLEGNLTLPANLSFFILRIKTLFNDGLKVYSKYYFALVEMSRYKVEVVLPKRSIKPLKESGEIIVLFNAWNEGKMNEYRYGYLVMEQFDCPMPVHYGELMSNACFSYFQGASIAALYFVCAFLQNAT